MKEYKPKDWHEEVAYFIVQPKESFRKELTDFFRGLFHCGGFTDTQKEEIAEILSLKSNELYHLFQGYGQVSQSVFEEVHARFTKLEWFVSEFRKVVKSEFMLSWLQKPNPIFENKRPLDLFTDEQFHLLQNFIWAINSGNPS